MAQKNKALKAAAKASHVEGYDSILADVAGLLESARRTSVRLVNSVMTTTYWLIGRKIVECEQGGQQRADYGEMVVKRLAEDLTARFGRGFKRSNLFQMKAFYLAYQDIVQTPSGLLKKGKSPKKVQTVSGQLDPALTAQTFPLSWSHYVRLLSVEKPEARRFYEAEALRCGWSVRQLDRQASTLFYERVLLSRNKASMLKKGEEPRPEDQVTVEEEIKNPYVLEFLNLKDEYSEADLEEALILKLESFLMELGGDFTFVGRQRRLRVGDAWYRVDLLFFHRRLKCLVVIDLKNGKFTHADAGQMHLYLNYAREHWMCAGENPPVGLILCTQRDAAVARYALEGLPNKVMAAEYRTALPNEKTLATEVEKTRKMLESRIAK